MRASFVSEYRKIVTTRTWWVLLVCMALYMAFLGAGVAWSVAVAPGAEDSGLAGGPDAVAASVYGVAAAFGYVFPVIVGALSVTTEYRHRTIAPTFLADPDRFRVLVAKLLAMAPVGLLFGVVGTAATAAAGAGVLAAAGSPTLLDDAATWLLLGRSVLALTVWALLGVALGAALTHQVVAVVVVLVYTQFLEPVLRLGLGAAGGAGEALAKLLPGAAGEAITGGSIFSSAGLSGLLPWWGGLLVLAAYVVALGTVGAVTALRRDVP